MSLSRVEPAPLARQGRSPSSLADFAPQSILALAAEPQRAVAVLIEPVEEFRRMVGWQTVELSERASPGECKSALVQAIRRLESQFNISLWDGERGRPRLYSPGQAVAEGVGQAFAVADLQAPLRVWLAGLSGGGSLAAGEAALAGALCNPVATYLPGPQQSPRALTREFQSLRPDVVLIVGGHEQIGPRSQDQVLSLSALVTEAAAQLHAEERPLFCYAGNSQSADAALANWRQRTGGGGGGDGRKCVQRQRRQQRCRPEQRTRADSLAEVPCHSGNAGDCPMAGSPGGAVQHAVGVCAGGPSVEASTAAADVAWVVRGSGQVAACLGAGDAGAGKRGSANKLCSPRGTPGYPGRLATRPPGQRRLADEVAATDAAAALVGISAAGRSACILVGSVGPSSCGGRYRTDHAGSGIGGTNGGHSPGRRYRICHCLTSPGKLSKMWETESQYRIKIRMAEDRGGL